MHREILFSCWPLLTAILVSLLALRVVWWLSGAHLRLSHLRHLHRDQQGGVQSLSFVLTLPLFMMILMFIVQLSQITIAKIVVEYSALAAVRSAMVWIPADLGLDAERENQISTYRLVESTEGDDGLTYRVYEIDERSEKFDKIHFAAAMALLPICPSRDVGANQDHSGNRGAASLQAAYAAMSPSTTGNSRIDTRLANKLAYALQNTRLTIRVGHKVGEDLQAEPELELHEIGADIEEFRENEIGWQDQLTVTVRHDFALLPGPGRLLARRIDSSADPDGDSVSENIKRKLRVYVYEIEATARLSNEGQKSVLPYLQRLDGEGGGRY
ncbi:MAG: pilus assembly protein [Planctomycetes bacterium]|nr:pilus assembly protein [Planctomycetota bacterium]